MFSIFSPSALIPFIVFWFASKIAWSCSTFFDKAETPSRTSADVLFAIDATSVIFVDMLPESSLLSSIVETISFMAALWSWLVAAFSFAATARVLVSSATFSPRSRFFLLTDLRKRLMKKLPTTAKKTTDTTIEKAIFLKNELKSEIGPSTTANHGEFPIFLTA